MSVELTAYQPESQPPEGSSAQTEVATQPININESVFYIDLSPNFDNEQLVAAFSEKLGLELEILSPGFVIDRPRLMTDDSYAASVLVSKWFEQYENHTQTVTAATQRGLMASGQESSVNTHDVAPVQSAVFNPHFYRDALGNPQLEITVDGEVISDQIRQSSEPIVNLSLQVGTLRLTAENIRRVTDYHEYQIGDEHFYSLDEFSISMYGDIVGSIILYTDNGSQTLSLDEAIDSGILLTQADYEGLDPFRIEENAEVSLQITEAYSPDFARHSLASLYLIALENPDKLIFAATGNHNSYFYDVQTQLRAEGIDPPANLALVGVYFGRSINRTDGATFYIHQERGLYSASEATGYLSGVATHLLNLGFAAKEIRPFMEQQLFGERVVTSPLNGKDIAALVSLIEIEDKLRDLVVLVPATESDRGTIFVFTK